MLTCVQEEGREQEFDEMGEGVCRAILRRAIEKTMIEIPQVVPAGPQSLEELLQTGGGRRRDEDELRRMLEGEDDFNSVDEHEKTRQGRDGIDAIFRWASPELKEALLARRRAKHAQACDRKRARMQAAERAGDMKEQFSVEMDRDRERIESALGVGEFENVWEGEEEEGQMEWDEARERERLHNPLQDQIRELLQRAEHNATARAEVDDINTMMRRFVSTHNATLTMQAMVKNFAVRAGFADMFAPPADDTVERAGGLGWPGLRDLGEEIDYSQWGEEAVPVLSDLEALRLASGNLSLRGVDLAIEAVGKQVEAELGGNFSITEGDAQGGGEDEEEEEEEEEEEVVDEFGEGAPSALDGLKEGEDIETLFNGGGQTGEDLGEGLTLKDRFVELGQRVRVVGLSTMTEFNGLVGEVVGMNDNGRVIVSLNHSSNATVPGEQDLDLRIGLLPERLELVDDEAANAQGYEALQKLKFPWLENPGAGPDTYGGPGYWEEMLSVRTSIELKDWGERLSVLGEGNISDVGMYLAECAHNRFVAALKSGDWASVGLENVIRQVSFRWGGSERWSVARRRRRRAMMQATREGRAYLEADEAEGEDETQVMEEAEEEEEVAYESLLCAPLGDGGDAEDDAFKAKVEVAKRRRAEEEADAEQEAEEEWGGARWIGRKVPVCGELDPDILGPSADGVAQRLREDCTANALCGWQKEIVIKALTRMFEEGQRDASKAFDSDWDEGLPNVDTGKYSVDENAELLADVQMTSLQRCSAQMCDVDVIDANTTDPQHWGELGPQLGGMVVALVNKTYEGTHPLSRNDEAPHHPPYRSKYELEEMRTRILCSMEDVQLNEIIINHYSALAAAATAAGCTSVAQWIDRRGGEVLLQEEIEKDICTPGSSAVLRPLEEEILRAALPEIAEAQKQYCRNEPCAGSVPQPAGLASTAQLLRGEYLFRGHKGWVGVSHWWPPTICSRPEWGFKANMVDGVAGSIRAMRAWGQNGEDSESAGMAAAGGVGRREETSVEGVGGEDPDRRMGGRGGEEGGGGGDDGGGVEEGNGDDRLGGWRGASDGATTSRRARRGRGISRSREDSEGPMVPNSVQDRRLSQVCEDGAGGVDCAVGDGSVEFQTRQGHSGVDMERPFSDQSLRLRGGCGNERQEGQKDKKPSKDSDEYDLDEEDEEEGKEFVDHRVDADKTERQRRHEAAREVDGSLLQQEDQGRSPQSLGADVGAGAADDGRKPGSGGGESEGPALEEGRERVQDGLILEPPHYGTEDESSALEKETLPERFRPFAKQVRGLVLRPPKDWKYAVELEDEADDKGAIQQAAQRLEDFDAVHALDPVAGDGGRRAELVGDKAVAIAASLRKRKYLLPAWRVLARAVRQAPRHVPLLVNYARLLNFEIYEREAGHDAIMHAVAVAPADPDVLLEHGYFLAERQHNVSAAVLQLELALAARPEHCETLVSLSHLLLRRNASLHACEDGQQGAIGGDTREGGSSKDAPMASLRKRSRGGASAPAATAASPATPGAGGDKGDRLQGSKSDARAGSAISRDVERAVELAGLVGRLEPKEPATLCLQAAVCEGVRGEVSRAKDLYSKALALQPRRWETALAFAHLQTRTHMQNPLMASEKLFQQAVITCDRQSPHPLTGYGGMLQLVLQRSPATNRSGQENGPEDLVRYARFGQQDLVRLGGLACKALSIGWVA
jgi:tetratricopeptide (TPR) repeat protein